MKKTAFIEQGADILSYGLAWGTTRAWSWVALIAVLTFAAPEARTQPILVSQPEFRDVIAGGPAVFTVVAEGTMPLYYQWRKEGIPLENATNAALVFHPAQLTNTGQYSVVVSNVEGSVISTNAALNVRSPLAGDLDFTFQSGPTINGAVHCVARQPDGQLLIGGEFTTVNGASRSRVARVHPDGTPDFSFLQGMAGANGTVESIALQPDGKVVIAGAFSTVNGISRGHIARLHQNGQIDSGFLNALSGTDNRVTDLAIQPNGQIVIGGNFQLVNGQARYYLARLNPDGTLDPSFLSGLAGPNNWVNCLSLQPNGKLLIGGPFNGVNGQTRSGLARLNTDGTVDTGFLEGMIGADNAVYCLGLQPDGKILAGGSFMAMNGIPRSRIARLNPDGSLDLSFLHTMAGANNVVNGIVVQSNGCVVIGGAFSTFNAVTRNLIARLNPDGSLDTAYQSDSSGAFSTILSMVLQPDGQVVIGGSFNTVNGSYRSSLARLSHDGNLDASFISTLPGPNAPVKCVAVQPDGKTIVAGSFTSVNAQTRNRIARLNLDGSLDTGFLNGLSGPNNEVYCLALQPDGRFLVGGAFSGVNGDFPSGIARLNTDATLDTGFLNGMMGADRPVLSLLVQPDGKVLVGGEFANLNAVPRNCLGRLNPDGSLDTNFLAGQMGANNVVTCLGLQLDGKVLVGGAFTIFNGQPRSAIARLNTDGTLDTGFLNGLAGANNTVNTLAMQSDGKIIIGGAFSSVNGQTRNRLARLNANGDLDIGFLPEWPGPLGNLTCLELQTNGKILVAGQATNRVFLKRLFCDGTIDPSFENTIPEADDQIHDLALTADAKMIVAGVFRNFRSASCDYLARLWSESPDPLVQALDGEGLTWTTGGDLPWTNQTAVSHDGTDAAHSLPITHGQQSWVETHVQGPGTLSFWWKVSSDLTGDFLGFYCDGILQPGSISGETDWQYYSTIIPSGTHALKWIYRKDASGSAGQDLGWLDEVQFEFIPAPIITQDPLSRTNTLGTTAVFSVAATGTPPLSYQWFKAGTALINDDHFSGVTANFLVINNAQLADAGTYYVIVTNIGGLATSANATLVVVDYSPQITLQPLSQTNAPGHIVRLDVIAEGIGPLSYQWYKDSVALVNDGRVRGATNANLFLSPVQLADSGDYTVVVSNGYGGKTSQVSQLTIRHQPPIILTPPQPVSMVWGGPAVFTVNADGSLPLTYQWCKNDLPIAGATNNYLRLDHLQFSDAAQYDVIISNVSGAITSSKVELTVNSPRPGDLDYSFDTGATLTHQIVATALLNDGKVYIGGWFDSLDGVRRGRLARLNPDGSVDPTFLHGLSGISKPGDWIESLTVQWDNKLLVGGWFTNFNGVTRKYLVRLNVDGSLDTEFLNHLDGPNSGVYAVAEQPDGKLLIGGCFSLVNQLTRNGIARLHPDGRLDTNFLSGLNGTDGPVYCVARQRDGQVLIGGDFSSVNGQWRPKIARLNQDGSVDFSFANGMAGPDGVVNCLALQPDGNVLIGGQFTRVNGEVRNRIARVKADGTVDSAFLNNLSGPDGPVTSLALQPDGKVIVGGTFSSCNDVVQPGVVRLTESGNLDDGFLSSGAGNGGDRISVQVQGDGQILVAGSFDCVNGQRRNRLARLNANGTLDLSFANYPSIGMSSPVQALCVQTDTKVLMSGAFLKEDGTSLTALIRVNGEGAADPAFMNGMSGIRGIVYAVDTQPDGKILVGGSFTQVHGAAIRGLARFNEDGSLDPNFLNGQSDVEGTVRTLATQPDGKILIGGWFTRVNGTARTNLARLNPNGSLDASFPNGVSGPSDEVRCLTILADGKILIGGAFFGVHGLLCPRIARLNPDGSLDTSFPSSPFSSNGDINCLAVQGDGKILIGGGFSSVYGVFRQGAARLNPDGSLDASFATVFLGPTVVVNCLALQPDGKTVVGLNQTNANSCYRLNSDGSLDADFMSGQSGVNWSILSLQRQPDGKILLGGEFTSVNGVPRYHVARLWSDVTAKIQSPPVSTTWCAGTSNQLTVLAYGAPPLYYQWRKNGVNLTNSETISGSDSPALTISPARISDGGDYTVVVSNPLHSVTSQVAVLSIEPNQAPSFVKGLDVTVPQGEWQQYFPGWASDVKPGPAWETNQTLRFELIPQHPGLFALAPSITNRCHLVFRPAPNARGTTSVTILLCDNGGTAEGGVDASAPQTFNITIGQPADSDSDGMPDDYELEHGLAPVSAADANLDNDGDGLTNRQEFTAGTDPTDGSSALMIQEMQTDDSGATVSFRSVLGKRYRVERNDNFPTGPWTVVAADLIGTGGVIEVVDLAAPGLPHAVYHVVLMP